MRKLKKIDLLTFFIANSNDESDMAATSTLMEEYYDACYDGNLDKVKKYVEQGVDINAECSDGRSAFRLACVYNKQDIVKYLIENGVDVARAHRLYSTGLAYASKEGHIRIVELLLEQNSSLNFIRHQSHLGKRTALIQAAKKGHEDIVRLLLFYDPAEEHIMIKDEYGRTAIDYAKTEKIRELLSTPFNHQVQTKRAKPSGG